MKRTAFVAALALVLVTLAIPNAQAGDPRTVRITLRRIGSGLSSPVGVVFPPDGSGRMFIVEQTGRIRVRSSSGVIASTPYLDLHTKISCCGERGLLGLAFHPSFRTNHVFWVYYTAASTGDLQISRYYESQTTHRGDPSTSRSYMTIRHRSYSNHNGGQLQFGPDGYLYIGTGDGGGAGDPNGNAQNLGSSLGKIMRIDVNRACGTKRYCIPGTNPYYGSTTRLQEIYEYGLRNPWRFSFDRTSGALWIGDAGQNAWEEADVIPKGAAGRNFGWDCREGFVDSGYGGSYCTGRTFTAPASVYGHTNGRCVIIGGYNYRGTWYSSLLSNVYVFGDYCTGEVFGIAKISGAWKFAVMADTSAQLTSFGQNPGGELYAVDAGGSLYRLIASKR